MKTNFFSNKYDSYSFEVYLLSCFPTMAALDSKCILLESATLHIFRKCKMYLLTVPSFKIILHFHRPRKYRGSKQYGLTVLNKHLETDKLGGTTSKICGQAPKRYPKLAAHDEFFPSLERNISRTGYSMEAQTTVSNSTQCGLFTGDYIRFLE